MKVAVFTDTFLPQINGVTNTLVKMIQYFEKHDIDYMIFAPEHDQEDSRGLKKVERFFSIKFFLYPECRVSLPNFFRVKNTLLNYKPDVIHLMTEFSMGLAGLYYGKKYHIPILSNYTTHFAQYLQYYNLQSFERNIWHYMKWFHNQSQYTLCASTDTESILHQEGIKDTAIFTRGVDQEIFSPRLRSTALRKELGIHEKTVLLYVGRVSVEKELDILFDAYQSLVKRYKEQIALIVTGDGPELEKYKKSFGDQVIFTGYKKGEELGSIYASSDLFVFPSSTETFGNVVLEAMAAGIPAVAPQAGGVKDIIKNRENGLFFNPGEAKDLEKKVESLLEDTKLYQEMKEGARLTAQRRGWESVFAQLVNIYQEVSENTVCQYQKIG